MPVYFLRGVDGGGIADSERYGRQDNEKQRFILWQPGIEPGIFQGHPSHHGGGDQWMLGSFLSHA